VSLLVPLGLLIVGLVVLTAGGESLVRGATALARLAGLTPAVIGLTVVAMGTSLPELVVSIVAALQGTSDLAVGNVIGSNIFNITATLGITAAIVALPVRGVAVRLEWPAMFVATALCVVFLRDLTLDRAEGGFFLLGLIAFTAYMVRLARREVKGEEREEYEDAVADRAKTPLGRGAATAAGFLIGGIILLVVGGRLFVDGAVALARTIGMSERVIGLTVVAAGTGMPEVATSIVAAARRQTDVAIANLIGSNMFNILGILGIVAIVRPITVTPAMVGTDLWWMLGTALLLFPLLRSGMRVGRVEGMALIGVYVAYLVVLLR
jgi:cation:H+ antiporter